MRLWTIPAVCVAACCAALCSGGAAHRQQQPQQGMDLFNGKDLSGWHADVPALDKDPNGRSPFLVRNGVLVSLGTPGGHLITAPSRTTGWRSSTGSRAGPATAAC